MVRSANRTLVLVSGGSKAGDEAMLEKARQSMEAGATGLIFGRNVWQRDARRVAAPGRSPAQDSRRIPRCSWLSCPAWNTLQRGRST